MPDQTTNPAMEAATELWDVVKYVTDSKAPTRYSAETEIRGFAAIISKHYAPLIRQARMAMEDLLDCIATDELIPESVSYMKQARAVLSKLKDMEASK